MKVKFTDHVNGHYKKPTGNITLNGKRQKAFFFR